MQQVVRALARNIAVRRWLIRCMVATTGLAMLATSNANFFFEMSQTVTVSPLELTADQPSAVVLITATATGLTPNGKSTTEGAIVRVRGTVGSGSTMNVDAAGSEVPRSVRVGIETNGSSVGTEDSVLTAFDLTRGMSFQGNCTVPGDPAAPCRGVVRVHFDREDGGQSGGSVSVDWSLVFSARAFKDKGPDELLLLPWQVEIVQP